MGDIDIVEMFLNFVMHLKQQDLSGVDLTPYMLNELHPHSSLMILREQWTQCGMGFKISPYNTIQGLMFAEEIVQDNLIDQHNIFQWDMVLLNLPGSATYKPQLPWDSKVWPEDNEVACDFLSYVDDLQPLATRGLKLGWPCEKLQAG